MADRSDDIKPASPEEIDKEYEASPTLATYLRLRRQHPDYTIKTYHTSGYEFLFSYHAELVELGIDPNVVEAAILGDRNGQSELALTLMQALRDRQVLAAEGETHLIRRKRAISDGLVNYLIALCLEAYYNREPEGISPDLIFLIKHQLGPIDCEYEVDRRRSEQRSKAVEVAFELHARGITPSYRNIAKEMGVQASTVKRWFPDRRLLELKGLPRFLAFIKDSKRPLS